MVKQMRVDNRFVLRRLHSKLGEVITWEVLNADKTVRLGVIRKVYDAYLVRRLGWREFKVSYWIGSRFWEPSVMVHPTQKGLLRNLFPHYYKELNNDQSK